MKLLALTLLVALAPVAWAQTDEEETTDTDLLRVLRPEPVSALRSLDDEDPAEAPAVRIPVLFEQDEAAEQSEDPSPVQIRRALRVEPEAEAQEDEEFLGRLSANPYAADSTSNPFSPAGSPYSARSVNNPYGQYGSPYSPTSARNPYATEAPRIVAQDGQYLGRLSENPYDPDSTANPYGRYGSPYSPTSINNPYSKYGSPYSPQSPNNSYSTVAPLLFGD
jgi:hypothetical protein